MIEIQTEVCEHRAYDIMQIAKGVAGVAVVARLADAPKGTGYLSEATLRETLSHTQVQLEITSYHDIPNLWEGLNMAAQALEFSYDHWRNFSGRS
jgi:hypothetical protein